MITCPAYYNRLRQAVDTADVVVLQSTFDEIRAHYLAFKRQEEGTPVRAMQTAFNALTYLVDVRGEEDFTVLMYASARYAMFKRQGKVKECAALDTVVAWLIEQGAGVGNEGARPIVKVHSRDGRPTFARGRGRNIVEALGQSNLPPTIQKLIDDVCDTRDGPEGLALRRWGEALAA